RFGLGCLPSSLFPFSAPALGDFPLLVIAHRAVTHRGLGAKAQPVEGMHERLTQQRLPPLTVPKLLRQQLVIALDMEGKICARRHREEKTRDGRTRVMWWLYALVIVLLVRRNDL